MAIKKKRRVAIKLDMTPMVDIAFLLLIFYMATTQFKPPEARAVTLPQSHSMIELPAKDIINMTVTEQDSMFVDYLVDAVINVDGKDIMTQGRQVIKVDKYNLGQEINRARAKNLRALIVIKADAGASFGTMQDVMNAMQENNLERFLIITELETDL